MASSKVVSTNPDLPRESSISPISSLLSDLHPTTMDDLLKSISPAAKSVDDVWKEIVAGHHDAAAPDNLGITLEDFLTKAGAVTEEDVRPLPEGSSSSAPHKGKRRAAAASEEPLDKATLQKQRRMIKNRESAARSRERKQAYTSELEFLVHQLEQENARLLNEEADMRRQRKKQLLECIIPIEVMPKPKKQLRRVNSAPSSL
ncbi:hypothetical protein Fmac_005024 [Flemingia macrophylla]|uniref:BZIP domain-containing protein n=1 Tax=Flemingia macrophylla TaxID=520843 RepID=A0ABD1N6R7_9FABA